MVLLQLNTKEKNSFLLLLSLLCSSFLHWAACEVKKVGGGGGFVRGYHYPVS